MSQSSLFQMLADGVLIVHIAFIVFVVLGLLLVIAGGCLRWRWTANLRFRLAHLVAIVFVVLESWFGVACPLTTLELWLRRRAGQVIFDGDFIAFWMRQFFFFEAPSWVFTLCYSVFAAMVVGSWLLFPPRFSSSERT